MTSLQERLQDAADDLVASGAEVGLQIAVVHNGRTVADVVAGMAAPERAVTPDTLFYAASTAKGVASALAHVLVERGELTYDMRAADVWPEYAAHGKGETTLRHVLLHTAGVPAPPYDTTVEDLCDWDHMCAALAASEPWWEPGSRFGYHAQTFGFLLGEIVRRATGRTLTWWLHEAVTRPLGVEDDVHFGVPTAHLPRVAHQEPPPEPPPAPAPADRSLPPGIRPGAAYANRPDVLTSDIPSAGTMTARGAARVYAALLGHVDGVDLVSPARLADMAAVHFDGMDEVMDMPATWAFGFSDYRPARPRPGSTFGMPGMNGSAAYADIDTGVAVAVMRNRFTPDLTALTRIDHIICDTIDRSE
ncbi:serine hydrolase domain-containing protein [Actinomadura geliboluensis]|uniref:serine hydrolase domain-containing protein n=1 Tax=Actinomadura geliboluensis TaxID=882440 RepID=UPI003720271B